MVQANRARRKKKRAKPDFGYLIYKLVFSCSGGSAKGKTIKGRKLVEESALGGGRGIGKKICLPRGLYKKLLRGIGE